MSTQVLENQTANVTEPDPQPVSAMKSYDFKLEIYPREEFKTQYATVRWTLDPNYAVGSLDKVLLKEGGQLLSEMRVLGSQTWGTNITWRTGLSASYVAWNYVTESSVERELVVTQST